MPFEHKGESIKERLQHNPVLDNFEGAAHEIIARLIRDKLFALRVIEEQEKRIAELEAKQPRPYDP